MKRYLFVAVFLVFALPARAQAPYSRSFPLKVGNVDVGEMVVTFRDVLDVGDFKVQVTAANISPSRSVLPPRVTPVPLAQLNSPVFVTIETNSSFRGPATVSLRIFLLEYDPQVPLRLFVAPGTRGSLYRDVTASVGHGSMYTSCYRESFSEFVIALDQRALQAVIETKMLELNRALELNAAVIDPLRYRDLRSLLDQVLQDLLRLAATYLQPVANILRLNLLTQTLNDLNRFVLSVEEGSAQGQIPDTYNDPTNPDGNVAGELFSRAQTAAFSLKLVQ